MKSCVRIIFLVTFSLSVAARVVHPEFKKGYYTPAQLGSLLQSAPRESLPDSNYEVSAYPVPAAELTQGDGLQEVQIYCNTCHSPRYITMQPPLPAASWAAEVKKMNESFGAGISEDSTKKIIVYLQTHYTPENREPAGPASMTGQSNR
jgi:mono/diheme cytochrome c family protein